MRAIAETFAQQPTVFFDGLGEGEDRRESLGIGHTTKDLFGIADERQVVAPIGQGKRA